MSQLAEMPAPATAGIMVLPPPEPRETDYRPDAQPGFVNLPAVAERLIAHCEPAARERAIRINSELEPDVLILGDAAALRRLLAQLLATALENVPARGSVTITGSIGHGIATLVVSTCWPRPLPKNSPPHWRGFGPHNGHRPLRGFGFQPSFVGDILRAHSGRMEVLHWPGQGSRFVLRVPVAPRPVAPVWSRASTSARAAVRPHLRLSAIQ